MPTCKKAAPKKVVVQSRTEELSPALHATLTDVAQTVYQNTVAPVKREGTEAPKDLDRMSNAI
jgi:hypothetical protein